MLPFNFKNVHIESMAFNRAPNELSSDAIEDRLGELYKKLKIPFGTLEKLSGIKTRYFYNKEDTPSKISTQVGQEALDQIGFDKEHLKILFNCSVTRDYFEPATSVLVHRNLGFAEDTMAMDITNACVGFSNGIVTLAQMIESGIVKAGLIVSGENLTPIIDTTFNKLANDPDIGRDELLKLMPTLTLGCGAVAMVLCHKDIATKSHRIVGSIARSASQHSELCIGNGDFCFCQEEGLDPLMETDSQELIASAARLGSRAWGDLSKHLGWTGEDLDHIFCHQVGRQVNKKFYDTMNLSVSKEHTVYEKYGNLVSAAMPSALITHANNGTISEGEKVLLCAYGSGLNAVFSGLVW